MGDAAVGFASVNLALRVIAIYKSDKRVMAFLIVVILGQYVYIISFPFLHSFMNSLAGVASLEEFLSQLPSFLDKGV
jgi:hypothetical protein